MRFHLLPGTALNFESGPCVETASFGGRNESTDLRPVDSRPAESRGLVEVSKPKAWRLRMNEWRREGEHRAESVSRLALFAAVLVSWVVAIGFARQRGGL